MSLRTKLVLLLMSAAAAPVLVAGLLTYRESGEALSGTLNELQSRTARFEAELAHNEVSSVASELSSAVLYEDPAALSPSEVQEFLTRVFLRRDRISIAALLDDRGRTAAMVFVDDPAIFARKEPQFRLHDTVNAREAEDFQARALAALQRRTQRLSYAISEPYLTQGRHRPAIVVAVPAPAGRKYALAAELSLDGIRRRLAGTYQGTTRAFLLDRDGRVLIHPDEGLEARRDSYGERVPALRGAQESGIAEIDESGTVQLAAYAPIADVGWTAVVVRPKEQALAPLRKLTGTMGGVLLVALAAAALIAVLVAAAVHRPIAELTKGALEFASGHFDYEIALHRSDEFGDLARTFNGMGESIAEANRRLSRYNEDLKAQVEERTRELKEAQQQLLRSQRLAAMTALAAGVAHEINNPLWAVIGNAQLLLLDIPPSRREHAMLSDIVTESQRIQEIVRGLLALSEEEKGGYRPVDLRSTLDSVLAAAGTDLRQDNIAVERKYDPKAGPVFGDASLLGQVFGHLLRNSKAALRGRPAPRLVVSTASVDGQAIRARISDNGCGIAKEHLERIFDPFFTTKKEWRGKGLGLSLCQRIIDKHGGRITIDSEEGKGTTVTVILPAAPPSAHLA